MILADSKMQVLRRGNGVITADEVVWAYRNLLGREPENHSVVQYWVKGGGATRFGDMAFYFLESEEFKRRSLMEKSRAYLALSTEMRKRGIPC
jgi:hypothetical protein